MAKTFKHIAIVGIGLIGGSLARAVKAKKIAETVTGYGRSLARLKKAHSYGLLDRFFVGFDQGLEEVELVVIATPAASIIRQAKECLPHLKSGTMLTDVGSVKRQIVNEIELCLPEDIYFIGGHPIAGTENSGFESSFASLFENKVCVLTPTKNSNQTALSKLKQFWTAVGSQVICMDVETHDKIFAAVSHLPHMVAFALVNAIVGMKTSKENILEYSAGGFKDFTRIAASDPVMWRDIALMNRDNVLETLCFFEKELGKLSNAIREGDGKGIEAMFKKSRDTRRGI